MPTKKNRKQSFTRTEKGDVKGKVGEVISNSGDRTPLGAEFPKQNRDLGPRIIKLRK